MGKIVSLTITPFSNVNNELGKVVDNSYKKKMPVKRRWNYRKVESLWWHNKLS